MQIPSRIERKSKNWNVSRFNWKLEHIIEKNGTEQENMEKVEAMDLPLGRALDDELPTYHILHIASNITSFFASFGLF